MQINIGNKAGSFGSVINVLMNIIVEHDGIGDSGVVLQVVISVCFLFVIPAQAGVVVHGCTVYGPKDEIHV